MDMLEVKNIRKSFASSEVQVLKDISFTIETGEFVCLLGKSGCGKSTLLDLLAGYTKPDGGELIIDGKKIKGPGIDRGLVFQEHALYPWYTVYQNICFGPKIQKKKNYNEVADEYLNLIGMKKYRDYYPDSLSGGMKQRVGIARALAAEPDVLLMDEPFSALDPSTRAKLRDDLIEIWQKTSKTIVFVTHSVPEAVYLADRVIAMKDGTIQFNEKIDIKRKRDMNDPKFVEYVNKIENFISSKKKNKEKLVVTND
ncbi:MAG: ABC transporter ATP-binding protein [Eubacterium sp.]|nr:ABC transporter ATP-binding protein [Eubacterium sp.]